MLEKPETPITTKTPTALLFVNTQSRQGAKHITTIREIFEHAGFTLIEPETESGADIVQQVNAKAAEADMVILGGGDGTLHTALPALLDTRLPLGILPLGTANDLARTLGLALDMQTACETIINAWQNQRFAAIDVGIVNERPFFNVTNMGLATEVTQKLNKHLKRRWGVFGYLIACWRAVHNAKSFKVKLQVNGCEHTFQSVQLSVGNGRHYGGGMIIRNDATIDDGRLDVYSLRPQSFWKLLCAFPLMRLGFQRRLQRVDEYTGKQISVTTSRPLRMTTDGEMCSHTPAAFTVEPAAIRVLVPANYTELRRQQASG